MPHPPLAIEISSGHVAGAHWGKTRGSLESFAVEYLADGVVTPSPMEANIVKPDDVRTALRRVFGTVAPRGQSIALLIPDTVVRVFILPFETLPRSSADALPLLRWRLKKSVPFDVEETAVSWTRQTGREGNLEIVAAVSRQRIIREYEEVIESLGTEAGVIMSSTLATLPLLEEQGSTLLVRISGRTLTTAIVRGANLCVYRSTEMPFGPELLEPKTVLDEIFPALAYYQDTWDGTMDRARLCGFGARDELFREILSGELRCPIGPISDVAGIVNLGPGARDIVQRGFESLAGWMMNKGA